MEANKTSQEPKNWISIRVKPDEYREIYRLYQKTTCRKLSEYVRAVLLQKPVTVTYRNQSAAEVMELLVQVKKELNFIGHNFNQAVRRLNSLEHIPEFKDWLVRYESDRRILLEKIQQTEQALYEMNRIWSQK